MLVEISQHLQKETQAFADAHGWSVETFVNYCVWVFVDPKSLPEEIQIGYTGLTPTQETEDEERGSENG